MKDLNIPLGHYQWSEGRGLSLQMLHTLIEKTKYTTKNIIKISSIAICPVHPTRAGSQLKNSQKGLFILTKQVTQVVHVWFLEKRQERS